MSDPGSHAVNPEPQGGHHEHHHPRSPRGRGRGVRRRGRARQAQSPLGEGAPHGAEKKAADDRKKVAIAKTTREQAKGEGGKPAFEWPTKPRDLLVKFLTERVSDAPDAPNRELPFITEAGVARFTGTAWRAWLVEQGIAVGKVEAGPPLRELGFVMRAFSLPGEGRALGMYLGDASKGTEKLPGARWSARAAVAASATPSAS